MNLAKPILRTRRQKKELLHDMRPHMLNRVQNITPYITPDITPATATSRPQQGHHASHADMPAMPTAAGTCQGCRRCPAPSLPLPPRLEPFPQNFEKGIPNNGFRTADSETGFEKGFETTASP
jgi:hypothetical protein